MNTAIKVCFIILVLAFVIPFLWEYVAIRFGISTGFKIYAIVIIENLRSLFFTIGLFLGCLVSILEWIEFEKMIAACTTVVSFYFQVFTSWWWTMIGFFSYVSVLNHPITYIVVGTFAATGLFVYVAIKKKPEIMKSEYLWGRIISLLLINACIMTFLYTIYENTSPKNHWINIKAWF